MNPLQKEPNEKHHPPTAAEIEQMMREQGVEPFDFDEAFGSGAEMVSDEELEEFLEWRRQIRQADRDAQEKSWQS